MQGSMYIDNLPTIRWRDFLKAFFLGIAEPEYSFNHLRSGLEFVLKQSSLNKAKKIMVPAFICPIVPEVIRRCGMEVLMADADLKTWNAKVPIETSADAVLICHTFGARMKIPHNKPVIEDCAHDITKKTEGDFGLYSMQKQFGNFGGGYVMTEEDLETAHEHLEDPMTTPMDYLRIMMKLPGPHKMILNFLRSMKGLPHCQPVEKEHWNIMEASSICQKLYKFAFGHFDPEKNQRIHTQLEGHFHNLGLEKIFHMQHMPAKSVPFNFSVRLREDDERKRDDILMKLRRKGVFADRLWYNADTSGLPNASLLARTVINLPLHPQSVVRLSYVV